MIPKRWTRRTLIGTAILIFISSYPGIADAAVEGFYDDEELAVHDVDSRVVAQDLKKFVRDSRNKTKPPTTKPAAPKLQWSAACTGAGVEGSGFASWLPARVLGSVLSAVGGNGAEGSRQFGTAGCQATSAIQCGEFNDLFYASQGAGDQELRACRAEPGTAQPASAQREPTKEEIRTSVAREFRKIKVAPAELRTDAIKPNTLKNAWTNFYVVGETTKPVNKNIKLLGKKVRIELTPDSWSFNYGDGSKTRTKDPGAILDSAADVWEVKTPSSHRYDKRGKFTVTATTSYSGRFSTNHGKTWTDIPGTLDIDTNSLNLRVWSMYAVNVSKDCLPGNPSQDPTCEEFDYSIFTPRQTQSKN